MFAINLAIILFTPSTYLLAEALAKEGHLSTYHPSLISLSTYGTFATNEPLAVVESSAVKAKVPVIGEVAVIVTLPRTDTVFGE